MRFKKFLEMEMEWKLFVRQFSRVLQIKKYFFPLLNENVNVGLNRPKIDRPKIGLFSKLHR